MSLPVVDQFREIPTRAWRSLARRLEEIELTEEWAAPWLDLAPGVHDPLRRPVERWNAQFAEGDKGTALRLLFAHVPVSESDASRALGSELTAALCAAGVLRRDGEILSTPFEFLFLDGILLLCDELSQGGDAVMGASVGTRILSRAGLPPGSVGRIADIGCGAGALSLALTPWGESVTASDVNARAFAFLETNAYINGLAPPEPRSGSLWEAFSADRIDWVVSQPPFLPNPPDAPGSTFLFGGRRGDELPLELLAGLDGHLTADGCAVLRVDWPVGDMPGVAERVHGALGGAWGAMLLHAPAVDADVLAATYADVQSRGAAQPYDSLFTAWREHLKQQGIIAVLPTIMVVRRAIDTWSQVIHLGEAFGEMTAPPVHELYRSLALLHSSHEALLASRWRMPFGGLHVTERPAFEGPARELLRFPLEHLAPEVELEPNDRLHLEGVAAAESLGAWLAEQPAGALEDFTNMVRLGVLRVNDD